MKRNLWSVLRLSIVMALALGVLVGCGVMVIVAVWVGDGVKEGSDVGVKVKLGVTVDSVCRSVSAVLQAPNIRPINAIKKRNRFMFYSFFCIGTQRFA